MHGGAAYEINHQLASHCMQLQLWLYECVCLLTAVIHAFAVTFKIQLNDTSRAQASDCMTALWTMRMMSEAVANKSASKTVEGQAPPLI